jgi:hypothetical protein
VLGSVDENNEGGGGVGDFDGGGTEEGRRSFDGETSFGGEGEGRREIFGKTDGDSSDSCKINFAVILLGLLLLDDFFWRFFPLGNWFFDFWCFLLPSSCVGTLFFAFVNGWRDLFLLSFVQPAQLCLLLYIGSVT